MEDTIGSQPGTDRSATTHSRRKDHSSSERTPTWRVHNRSPMETSHKVVHDCKKRVPWCLGRRDRRDTRPMMSEQEQHIPIRRRLLLGLVALAVGGTLAAIPAYRNEFQLAPLWYNVIGVDVSNHQGDIDW